MMNPKPRIAIAMSGGVDSSVVAAILKNQGYDVFGVFFHFWAEPSCDQVRENVCCSLEAQEDARRVAQQLGIKFYTLNLSQNFKEDIVDSFLSEYGAGRTPNPCVRCNRFIKFGEALKRVKLLGADYLATGHYAKIKTVGGKVKLLKSKDTHKDQTYFLSQLTQTQLKHVLFPIGHLTKPEVRDLAKKFNLATATKRESQEVCFIPDGDLSGFLKKYLPMASGEMRDFNSGDKLGEHDGLFQYTIGQRKGIGLAGGPWYVVKLEVKKNILWLTKNLDDLKQTEFWVRGVNWIAGEKPELPLKVKCRIRYGAPEVIATIVEFKNGKYLIKLAKPQLAITPGQSAVFWSGQSCLGSGTIY